MVAFRYIIDKESDVRIMLCIEFEQLGKEQRSIKGRIVNRTWIVRSNHVECDSERNLYIEIEKKRIRWDPVRV